MSVRHEDSDPVDERRLVAHAAEEGCRRARAGLSVAV